jgi:hypothetical protein
MRPGPIATTTAATKLALRLLGERYQALDGELARVDAELDRLTTQAAPGTAAAVRGRAGDCWGVAGRRRRQPWAAAQQGRVRECCAAASPIPASSGKTVRYRLNRGGNRQANTALYRIVVVRLCWHQPTRADLARRTRQGLSKREIIRCLKRYVAREVFAALQAPATLAATA